MMIMEHQENLEKFVVFKTNNHHVSMKVSLRSSFQFEDEVHDLLASYIVYLIKTSFHCACLCAFQ